MPTDSTQITIPANTDMEYYTIRAALNEAGFKSLSGWARQHRFAATTTYAAARGRRAGKQSRKIQTQLRKTLYGHSE